MLACITFEVFQVFLPISRREVEKSIKNGDLMEMVDHLISGSSYLYSLLIFQVIFLALIARCGHRYLATALDRNGISKFEKISSSFQDLIDFEGWVRKIILVWR